MPTKKPRCTLQLDPRTHARIKRLAQQDGHSLALTVRLAVEAYAALRTQWKQPR